MEGYPKVYQTIETEITQDDAEVREDQKRAAVSALVYSAITLHILSMKLLLSGFIVASGSLFRQVLETIALACLCSSKSLNILERYMNDDYLSMNAMGDALRHSTTLNLKREALEALKQARKWYHQYSHPTLLTITTHVSFSEEGLYVGAFFDEGKLPAYKKEIAGRLGLAQVFSNFIDGVKMNMEEW